MNTYRKTAIAVGVLFIGAIVMLFIGESIYRDTLDSPDFLENAHPDRGMVVLGILLEYAGAPAVVAISLLLFPVLKQHSEVLAMGYVGFRLMEMSILSVAYVSRLSLISLSEDYLSTDGADVSSYQVLGRSIESVNQWAGTQGMVYIIIFGLGSLVLYSALFMSELVPRWISASGLFAAVVLMIGSILWEVDVLGDLSGVWLEVIVASPIAIVEVALSMWLIIKGFNQSALNPPSFDGHQQRPIEWRDEIGDGRPVIGSRNGG